jgi:hypothetical protein
MLCRFAESGILIMIADEPIYSDKPQASIIPGTTLNYILNSIKSASQHFKAAYSDPKIIRPLNENKLSQMLVQLIGHQIKSHAFLSVNSQYADMFESSATGIPDFYFYRTEEDKVHAPIFVVESKRLPSPTFETEYVKGEKKNGGIERFKIEKHAKGFDNCGLVGFVEKNNPAHWLKTVNGWIESFAKTDATWNKSELLTETETEADYVTLKSTAQLSGKTKKIQIHHFWIIV